MLKGKTIFKRNIRDKEEDEKYQFMREQIRPQRKRAFVKYIKKLVSIMILAVVFGVLSSAAFLAVQKVLAEDLNGGAEETLAQNTAGAGDSFAGRQILDEKEDLAIDFETLEGYQTFWEKASVVGKRCNQYIVSVESAERSRWFEETENTLQSGAVFRETDKNYYILTFSQEIADLETIEVTFWNGTTANAKLAGKDNTLGIVVLSVAKVQLSEEDKETIRVAKFGQESNLKLSTPVIALGNPNGVLRSVMPGNVVNDDLCAGIIDGKIDLYSSNIGYCEEGNGFVADMRGRLVGIITTSFTEITGDSNCAFMGMSRLRTLIHQLADGKELVYLGIKGCDVNKKVNENLGTDSGVYVTDVISRSPAYQGEIRVADVITRIDKNDIENLQEMRECLLSHKPGDEIVIYVNRNTGERQIEKHMKVSLK